MAHTLFQHCEALSILQGQTCGLYSTLTLMKLPLNLMKLPHRDEFKVLPTQKKTVCPHYQSQGTAHRNTSVTTWSLPSLNFLIHCKQLKIMPTLLHLPYFKAASVRPLVYTYLSEVCKHCLHLSMAVVQPSSPQTKWHSSIFQSVHTIHGGLQGYQCDKRIL